jgi:hypothetical protein
VLTLKTTCKRCNARNRDGKTWVDWHSCFGAPTLCTGEAQLGRALSCVVRPWCKHAAVPQAPELQSPEPA